MTDLKKELDRAVLGLFQSKQSAFLGTMYCGLKFNWEPSIPTACTNGKRLMINPDWFLTLTPRSRIALLAHELWHVAFMHMLRLENRHPLLWNMAADHAINLMLLENGYHFDMPCLADQRFAGMTSEQIYDVLDSENTRIDLPFGEDFAPIDDKVPEEEASTAEAGITALIIRAKTMADMSGAPGNMPGEIEEALDKLLNPVIPWDVLMRRWLTERAQKGFTWARPNRRFLDQYMPSRGGEEGLAHILWAIDASCSMTREQLIRINSELAGVQSQFMPEKMTIVTFDTVIQDTWVYESGQEISPLVIHGRGGTWMQPVFDLARELKPTALVMLSDMECAIPEAIPGIHVLWVCLDDPTWVPPYGEVVHVDSTPPSTA